MKIYILLLFIISHFSLYADDIYFGGGCMVHNITVIRDDLDTLIVKTSDNQKIVFSGFTFYKITPKEVKDYIESSITNCSRHEDPVQIHWDRQYQTKFEKGLTKMEYQNLKLLPISVFSFALSYNFFTEASDKQDSINELKNLLPSSDTSKLESQRNRYYIMGGICALVGLVNTFISINPVEVQSDNNRINLSYSF